MRRGLMVAAGVALYTSILGAVQSAPITDDEFERLYHRMLGNWEMNLDKSVFTFLEPIQSTTAAFQVERVFEHPSMSTGASLS